VSKPKDPVALRCSELERHLQATYGSVLTLAEIARVFRYPTTQAAQKANARGKLPVVLSKMPHRRKWFASARSVAEALARLEVKETAAMS